MRSFQKIVPSLIIILLAAAGLKFVLLWLGAMPFNSDEAVVGLMARHIQAGARPLFFYGQAYMGSLDAFLVAVGFSVFGQEVWVIRLVQCILYLGTIITTVIIGREVLGSIQTGLLAALLMAVPTVNVTLYTTVSLGGYGEALLLGNLILLLGVRLSKIVKSAGEGMWKAFRWRNVILMFVWGALVGMGLWANGLTLVYSIPVGLMILWVTICNVPRLGRRPVLVLVVSVGLGFLVGSAPWWVYSFQQGWHGLIVELLGSAVAVEGGTWLEQRASHLFYLLIFGSTAIFGVRPPWEIRWLFIPLIPFVLAFWLGVISFTVKRFVKEKTVCVAYGLLLGIILFVSLGFVFTSFGVDPSGRYFLPVWMPLALFAAEMVRALFQKARWQVGLIGFIMLYNLMGTFQCALQYPGLTTQFDSQTIIDHRYDAELIDFLKGEGELNGYSNYWVTYPIAFLSDEAVVYVPRLPYHQDLRYTSRDNRYRPYAERVGASDRAAYITTHSTSLDRSIRETFQQMGVEWKEKIIGDYLIFYQLSVKVLPEELGLREVE